ncbi:hypothetical protein SAMN06298216_4242 [Spirosomataceae bacterium TFI 002]|nr:hypothetical protein SAMN06298216_4242 [Spirosomataceae bacterium TFI 002]
MKNLVIIIFLIFCTSEVFSQVYVGPEEIISPAMPKKQAKLTSSNNKPYWIGVGGYPHIHLDSSSNHKIGIGVGHKSGNTFLHQTIFTEHAKVHIRHEGGPGSDFQNQKGPHLLLDESTADNPAVIRFRQSTLETTPTSGGAEKMTPGLRHWDIRAFANGESLGQDEFRILNSGATEDLVNIDGDGQFTFTGEGNTLMELKGPASSDNLIKFEFGKAGSTNGGKIWYNPINNRIQFLTGSKRSLELDDGLVKIGSDVKAPKIKTWFETVTTSTTAGVGLNYAFLPAPEDKILSVSCMITGEDGVTGQIYAFSIDGTTISFESFGSNYLGKEIRMFVTYTE